MLQAIVCVQHSEFREFVERISPEKTNERFSNKFTAFSTNIGTRESGPRRRAASLLFFYVSHRTCVHFYCIAPFYYYVRCLLLFTIIIRKVSEIKCIAFAWWILAFRSFVELTLDFMIYLHPDMQIAIYEFILFFTFFV